MKPRLEVHRHSIISGPRNGQTIEHSHEGPLGHQHEHCGPATYTICRDEWYRATGLKGGGVKKYTAKPKGEQLPLVDLEEWKSFRIVTDLSGMQANCPGCARCPACGDNHKAPMGGGLATAVRMVKQFGIKVSA